MNHHDNKHCTETAFSCRYHYKTNDAGHQVACGELDNPTSIQLRPKNGQWPSIDFEMPRQNYELGKVEQLMGYAYKLGQRDKMREISNTLKTVIGI